MFISQIFVSFIFYSFLGWIWESFYELIKTGHFTNRGFLFGPICPIYGFSVVLLEVIWFITKRAFPGGLPAWGIFLICAGGSAIAEYATSWYLEKRFHARWWDYSDTPFNLNGRICLPVTLAFGVAGIVIVHYVLPYLAVRRHILAGFVYEALALILMALLAADFALTEASLNDLLERIEIADQEFSQKAESLYESISSKPAEFSEKVKIVLDREVRQRVLLLSDSLSRGQKAILERIESFRPLQKGTRLLNRPVRLKNMLLEMAHHHLSLKQIPEECDGKPVLEDSEEKSEEYQDE